MAANVARIAALVNELRQCEEQVEEARRTWNERMERHARCRLALAQACMSAAEGLSGLIELQKMAEDSRKTKKRKTDA